MEAVIDMAEHKDKRKLELIQSLLSELRLTIDELTKGQRLTWREQQVAKAVVTTAAKANIIIGTKK